jgi:hypothetical protein
MVSRLVDVQTPTRRLSKRSNEPKMAKTMAQLLLDFIKHTHTTNPLWVRQSLTKITHLTVEFNHQGRHTFNLCNRLTGQNLLTALPFGSGHP